jgi:tol-pal system protein YbgF
MAAWFLALPAFLFLVSCSSLFSKGAGNRQPSVDSAHMAEISALESEIASLKKDQAKLKAGIKAKDASMAAMKTKLTRMEKKIRQLEKAAAKARHHTVTHSPVRLSAREFYKKARNLFLEENFEKAGSMFVRFEKNWPENSLADNAVYWLGECYYSLGKYKKAAIIFKKLTKTYPKSEKVPDALLKTAYAYLSLDDTNRAHYFLIKLVKNYPFSPAAEKAQVKLKDFE